MRSLLLDPNFADAKFLTATTRTHALFSLEILADRYPEAEMLAQSGQRSATLHSSAVRCALASLLTRPNVALQPEWERLCRNVLREAAEVPLGRLPEGEIASLGKLGTCDVPLLFPQRRTTAAKQLLERQLAHTVGADLGVELITERWPKLLEPTDTQIRSLRDAVDLLGSLVPDLAASVATHLHMIALVAVPPGQRLLSASNSTLPGALFLSRTASLDRLAGAEAILHEVTHQRLYDLMLCHRLYVPGYSAATSPHVVPPWYAAESGRKTAWTADRAVAAFHVYAHLVVLWSAALAGCDDLSADERAAVQVRYQRCLDKGRYLTDALHGTLRLALAEDGQRFIEFLERSFNPERCS